MISLNFFFRKKNIILIFLQQLKYLQDLKIKLFRELRDILNRVPDIALVIYGSSAWNGFHTFFLPSNKAFSKVIDRNRIDREVLLVHVTGINRVLFTYPWLYDGGIHYYPTVRYINIF